MTDILERGNIYFAYRPKVESREEHEKHEEKHEPEAEGLGDVERFYMILGPHGKKRYRLIVVGQKKLPDIKDGGQKYWAFVEKVGHKAEDVENELSAEEYDTKTRGRRHVPAARPAGEGVYMIARHEDHTHLAFALELPDKPGKVQREFNIEDEGSYVLSIKNPEKPSPPGAGLRGSQDAHFPKRLQSRFENRRFFDADPPDFLDYKGAELLLIGAEEDVSEDLGIDLDPQKENEHTAEIFNDLRMRKSEHPVEPLFKGEWQ